MQNIYSGPLVRATRLTSLRACHRPRRPGSGGDLGSRCACRQSLPSLHLAVTAGCRAPSAQVRAGHLLARGEPDRVGQLMGMACPWAGSPTRARPGEAKGFLICCDARVSRRACPCGQPGAGPDGRRAGPLEGCAGPGKERRVPVLALHRAGDKAGLPLLAVVPCSAGRGVMVAVAAVLAGAAAASRATVWGVMVVFGDEGGGRGRPGGG